MLSRILPLCNHNYYIERVKFGAPLDQVCCIHNDIPGPLLILILKLNKEAPYKKDVFRAPGHQANMKKLIHFLQTGRLVNIDNFSVYTIASVLKKFLRKLPGGIFGPHIESRLFEIIEGDNVEQKREEIHRLIVSLPPVNQHLLVLLFGTFRAIASSSEKSNTGMTSEALGVSVAPSFFQSCVSDGCKIAKMEDVHRFKAQIAIATMIMKFLIDNFGVSNLFGRDNYEYYAKISGRVLKVEENWIFAFKYPPDKFVSQKSSLESDRKMLQNEWALSSFAQSKYKAISSEECHSTPTLYPSSTSGFTNSKTGDHGSQTRKDLTDDVYTRLSMSLEENFFKMKTSKSNPASTTTSPTIQASPLHYQPQQHDFRLVVPDMQEKESLNLEQLRKVNRYAESTKSLSFLPMVHERQTQRMKTRSEWFLNPSEVDVKQASSSPSPTITTNISLSASPSATINKLSNKSTILRRASSKEKRLLRRNSSKKDKENGNKNLGSNSSCRSTEIGDVLNEPANLIHPTQVDKNISTENCTDMDVFNYHISLTYKPRI